MDEQLVPRSSAIASDIASHLHAVSRFFRSELPSPRLAVGVAGATLALWLAGGAAAGGLGLLALATAVIAFGRPYLLGPFVALLLPFGDRIEVQHVQVAPLEAVIGGGAIGYVVRLAIKRDELRFRLFHWVFAALIVLIGLSMLGPAGASLQAHEFLLWGALGCVCHAVTTHLDSRRNLRLLLVGIALPTLFEASLAFFQYVDSWSQRFSRLNGAIVYPLPKGTLHHPNALAQFLVLASFAVFALVLAERGLLRWCGLLVAGAGGLALVVTFSRASWIAVAIGGCVYLVERKARVRVVAAGAVVAGSAILALVAGGAIGERIASLFTANRLSSFRIELWERGAHIAAAHPLTGSGHFSEAGIYAGRPDVVTHPHNLFLGLAVFYGIPAAVAFAGLVLLALRATLRGSRQESVTTRVVALGFLPLLVAFLINGVFEYPFWNLSLTTLIVLLLAVSVTLDRRAPEGHGFFARS